MNVPSREAGTWRSSSPHPGPASGARPQGSAPRPGPYLGGEVGVLGERLQHAAHVGGRRHALHQLGVLRDLLQQRLHFRAVEHPCGRGRRNRTEGEGSQGKPLLHLSPADFGRPWLRGSGRQWSRLPGARVGPASPDSRVTWPTLAAALPSTLRTSQLDARSDSSPSGLRPRAQCQSRRGHH